MISAKKVLKLLYHWLVNSFYYYTQRYNKTGKIALCCIAKCENDYIREFVEYYKDMGIDNIYIYDNNDIDGERFDIVLKDHIESGFCKIIDIRGHKVCQWQSYKLFYDQHRMDYDWIMYFDCDEFLTFTNPRQSLKSFLSEKKYKKYQMIHVNWLCYGDNNLLDNDGRKVTERFVEPVYPLDFKLQYDFPENNHVKTIVRGGLKDIQCSVHLCYSPYYKCCTPNGLECDILSPFCNYDHSIVYLRHYRTKTIGEWIRIKQNRGYADQTDDSARDKLDVKSFFRMNEDTQEKREYIKKLLSKQNP